MFQSGLISLMATANTAQVMFNPISTELHQVFAAGNSEQITHQFFSPEVPDLHPEEHGDLHGQAEEWGRAKYFAAD